jgi:hypothetical protein
MLAIGIAVIVTFVVAVIAEHPPDAGDVYVIVKVPGVDVDGVIAPVPASSVSPVVELYVPPMYEPVPVKVTDWAVETDVQNELPL